MEKVGKLVRLWFEPAVLIGLLTLQSGIILYVMDVQIDSVKAELTSQIGSVKAELTSQIDGVKAELSLFRGDVNRRLSRQDTEIKSTDKKIDDLKKQSYFPKKINHQS